MGRPIERAEVQSDGYMRQPTKRIELEHLRGRLVGLERIILCLGDRDLLEGIVNGLLASTPMTIEAAGDKAMRDELYNFVLNFGERETYHHILGHIEQQRGNSQHTG